MRITRAWAVAHAYAVLRDYARAEECVQQAHLEIWQNAHRYDPDRGGAKGWMLAVIRHRAVDDVRASESERRRLTTFETREYRWDTGPDHTYDAVHARLDGYVVHQALAGLSDKDRQVLQLSYWSGMSHSEIAVHLGLPLGTVKSRIRTAMLKLRDHVTPEPA